MTILSGLKIEMGDEADQQAEREAGPEPTNGAGGGGKPKKKAKPAKEEPPVAGAKKAKDGHWYVKKPHARGEYHRVIT